MRAHPRNDEALLKSGGYSIQPSGEGFLGLSSNGKSAMGETEEEARDLLFERILDGEPERVRETGVQVSGFVHRGPDFDQDFMGWKVHANKQPGIDVPVILTYLKDGEE